MRKLTLIVMLAALTALLVVPAFAQRGQGGGQQGGGQQGGGQQGGQQARGAMTFVNTATEMFMTGSDIYLYNNKTVYKLTDKLVEVAKVSLATEEEATAAAGARGGFNMNMFQTAKFITKADEEGALLFLLILDGDTLYNIDPATLTVIGSAKLTFVSNAGGNRMNMGAMTADKFEWAGNILYILRQNQLIYIDFDKDFISEPYTIAAE